MTWRKNKNYHTNYSAKWRNSSLGKTNPNHRYFSRLLKKETNDYLTSNNLVEVQGFGKKQIIHMKPDKWEALLWWDRNVMPVQLFLYDSHNDREIMFPIKKLRPFVDRAEIRTFPEGKEYYAIKAEEVWTTLGS